MLGIVLDDTVLNVNICALILSDTYFMSVFYHRGLGISEFIFSRFS